MALDVVGRRDRISITKAGLQLRKCFPVALRTAANTQMDISAARDLVSADVKGISAQNERPDAGTQLRGQA